MLGNTKLLTGLNNFTLVSRRYTAC